MLKMYLILYIVPINKNLFYLEYEINYFQKFSNCKFY